MLVWPLPSAPWQRAQEVLQLSFGSAAEAARAAAKPTTLANRIIFFIVFTLFGWCIAGAVVCAFSNDSVVEASGIHYPCFGQPTAFFASPKKTTNRNVSEEPAENALRGAASSLASLTGRGLADDRYSRCCTEIGR